MNTFFVCLFCCFLLFFGFILFVDCCFALFCFFSQKKEEKKCVSTVYIIRGQFVGVNKPSRLNAYIDLTAPKVCAFHYYISQSLRPLLTLRVTTCVTTCVTARVLRVF